jgi:hypothetical protein
VHGALASQPTDLVSLNAAILANPKQSYEHPRLQTLAKRDPELSFLCPLARALYLLENNDCEPSEALIALETCWFIDDSLIFKEKGWQLYDNVDGRELVKHSMQVFAAGVVFELGFTSEAEFLFCSDEYKNLMTSDTAANLLTKKSQANAFSNPNLLVKWLESKDANPIGYPEGEDEPLCLIKHQLTSINGVNVSGPTMNCGYHETTIEDLSEHWSEDQGLEEMSWLHALTPELARRLGIGPAHGQDSLEPSSLAAKHPSWLSTTIDIDSTWINAEQLQESYSKGRRVRIKDAPIRLALGCGEDWTPTTDREDEEACDPEGSEYPLANPPVLILDINPACDHFNDSIELFRPYLLKLAEIAMMSDD